MKTNYEHVLDILLDVEKTIKNRFQICPPKLNGVVLPVFFEGMRIYPTWRIPAGLVGHIRQHHAVRNVTYWPAGTLEDRKRCKVEAPKEHVLSTKPTRRQYISFGEALRDYLEKHGLSGDLSTSDKSSLSAYELFAFFYGSTSKVLYERYTLRFVNSLLRDAADRKLQNIDDVYKLITERTGCTDPASLKILATSLGLTELAIIKAVTEAPPDALHDVEAICRPFDAPASDEVIKIATKRRTAIEDTYGSTLLIKDGLEKAVQAYLDEHRNDPKKTQTMKAFLEVANQRGTRDRHTFAFWLHQRLQDIYSPDELKQVGSSAGRGLNFAKRILGDILATRILSYYSDFTDQRYAPNKGISLPVSAILTRPDPAAGIADVIAEATTRRQPKKPRHRFGKRYEPGRRNDGLK